MEINDGFKLFTIFTKLDLRYLIVFGIFLCKSFRYVGSGKEVFKYIEV